MLPPALSPLMLAASFRQRSECGKRGVEEPSEPDAFAFTASANQIEAVVPVPGSDQRQAVTAKPEALVKAPRAMFEQGALGLRDRRLKVRLQLLVAQYRPIET